MHVGDKHEVKDLFKVDDHKSLDQYIEYLCHLARDANEDSLRTAVIEIKRYGAPAVLPLVYALRNSSSKKVRYVMRCALTALDDVAVDQILVTAKKPNSELMVDCAKVLAEMNTPRSPQALCELVLMQLRKHDRYYSIRHHTLFLVRAVFVVAGWLSCNGDVNDKILVSIVLWCVSGLLAYFFSAYKECTSEILKICLNAIQDKEDRSLMPILLEFMSGFDNKFSTTIRRILIKQLLDTRASDRAIYTPDVMRVLTNALDHCLDNRSVWWGTPRLTRADIALSIAILKALEQVGDEIALKHVQQLAHACSIPEIRRAAEECLPALRASASTAQQANMLLRPAEPAQATTLLRPAAATQGDQSALLRPVSPSGDQPIDN